MIHITAQGGQNYTNELRALAPGRKSGFFVLAFRLYDVGKQRQNSSFPLDNKPEGEVHFLCFSNNRRCTTSKSPVGPNGERRRGATTTMGMGPTTK